MCLHGQLPDAIFFSEGVGVIKESSLQDGFQQSPLTQKTSLRAGKFVLTWPAPVRALYRLRAFYLTTMFTNQHLPLGHHHPRPLSHVQSAI